MLANKKAAFILIATSIIIALAINFYQERRAYVYEPYTDQRIMLDTLVTIKAYGADKAAVESAVSAAMARIIEIDKKANAYSAESEVSKANLSAFGKDTKLSPDLYRMIDLSLKYWAESDGAFDISVRPLVLLWDMEKREIPYTGSLDGALAVVGSDKINFDKVRHTLRFSTDGAAIDLGAVAKGYAADAAALVLQERGIISAIVTTGSTTAIIGDKPRSGWQKMLAGIGFEGAERSEGEHGFTLGIQHPRKKTGELLAKIHLADKNISTSGDYQQYFLKNGVRYHHILDPATGMPAHGLQSVTVITTRSDAEADILSTALFVMGKKRSIQWLKDNPDVQAVLVDDKGDVLISKDLKDQVAGLSPAPRSF